MKPVREVIVLGGGYSGVLTAKHLAKRIKKEKISDVRIRLIDKNPFHTMLTELHEVAAGRVGEESIRMDLREIFYGRNVEIVQDNIQNVDIDGKILKGNKSDYSFDYLVVGSGSRPTWYGIEGAEQNAFSLWSYDDAVKLREHIIDCFTQAYRTEDEAKKRKLLTFVVAGAGFTGVEMAGELAEYAPTLCERYRIPAEMVRIVIVDLIDRVVPTFPQRLSDKVERRLKKMGVEIRLGCGVSEILPDGVTVNTKGSCDNISADTVIWTAGIEASKATQSVGAEQKNRGRLVTDKYLRADGHSNIFVVGDNIFYIPEGSSEPVPQMVENAEHSSKLCAKNLLAQLKGQPDQLQEYKPAFHGAMLSVGGRWASAYVGTDKKMFALPSFIAMGVKHLINMVYFVQVLGFAKVFSYMRHEFFQVKSRRSFVGGHLSRNTPNFWLAPFRVFMGIMWLVEFWGKWPKFSADPSNIFLFSIPTADGVSAATGAAEVADAVASATVAVEEAVSAYGPALPVPGFILAITDWAMATVIAPIAPFVQGAMIIGELLVGLALIAGLLTVPALLASILMCVMIYSSGMASQDILWFFFGSVGLLAGGASNFSFDYYLLPYLRRWWNSRRIVQKLYLTVRD